jgi:hypothetical protein
MKTIQNYLDELDRYKEYLNFYIALRCAVEFKYHRYCTKDTKLWVPNSLWNSQIPTFEEYWEYRKTKGWKKSGSFLTIPY